MEVAFGTYRLLFSAIFEFEPLLKPNVNVILHNLFKMSKRDCSPAGKRLKLGESFQLFDQKLGSNVREVAFSIAYPGRELKLMEVW